ncbi:hypothetical protein HK101_005674 [Irineochytrium annulatum]|nr:hypothetical protein HK101_005674 [Irineochytrium annulatum]
MSTGLRLPASVGDSAILFDKLATSEILLIFQAVWALVSRCARADTVDTPRLDAAESLPPVAAGHALKSPEAAISQCDYDPIDLEKIQATVKAIVKRNIIITSDVAHLFLVPKAVCE